MKIKLNLSLRRSLYTCSTIATLALAAAVNQVNASEPYVFEGDGDDPYPWQSGDWTNPQHWSPSLLTFPGVPTLPFYPSGVPDSASVEFNTPGTVENVATTVIGSLSLVEGGGSTIADSHVLKLHCKEEGLSQIIAIKNEIAQMEIYYSGVREKSVHTISNSGWIKFYNADLTVTNGIYSPDSSSPLFSRFGGNIDVAGHTLRLIGTQKDQTISRLTAAKLYVENGKVTLEKTPSNNDSIKLETSNGGEIALRYSMTIGGEVTNNGTISGAEQGFTLSGKISGNGHLSGSSVSLTNSDQNQSVGSIYAGRIGIADGHITVASITRDDTTVEFSGTNGTLKIAQNETLSGLVGSGTISSDNHNLTLTDSFWSNYSTTLNFNLGRGTLSVAGFKVEKLGNIINKLSVGKLIVAPGLLTINDILAGSMDLDIANGATVILNEEETITGAILNTGTLETANNKNFTLIGTIAGADVVLGAGQFKLHSASYNNVIDSLTVGNLRVFTGGLAVNSITSNVTDVIVDSEGLLFLKNTETIRNLSGYGQLETDNKDLTVTGTITDAALRMNLGTGTLIVNNDVANREIYNLVAGGLTLNAGALTVNELQSDTTDITVADGATLTLKRTETIKDLLGVGRIETNGSHLTVTGAINGANMDLGAGTLAVNNESADRRIGSLTAKELTLGATANVALDGQGSVEHLKGVTAESITVLGGARYNFTSANNLTLTVQSNAEVTMVGNLTAIGLAAGSEELSNVTLNIQASGKVQSKADYLGTGNTINNNGTLVLKGGTLNSDINNPTPFSGTNSSSLIIIDGLVGSDNRINTTLTEFSITDSATFDQLTLGSNGRLNTAAILIDISNYTLTEGDTFYFITSWSDWGTTMDGVQLSFKGQDLLGEGFDYTIINTGEQWGLSFLLAPEPSTATLSLLALAGLLARRRRQTV